MTILTTVLSVSAISGILAVVIILAEHYLNNYGECEININDGKRVLKADGGSSLLSTLAAQKIFIPSACGGKATCGLCKVIIKSGAGPILPTEEPYLDARQREQGYRMACQVKVKGNMTIEVPDELFNIREFNTTIESITQWTHDIKGLRLKLPPGDSITFKAGQYVNFYSKPYAKVKESVFRAYSIASVPSDHDAIELIIRQVPEGLCTTYVHTMLKEGDPVTISGPYGDFFLRGEHRHLIMIAGGSGLAPIRSLVLDILEKGLDLDMTFFFGAVTKRDLYNLEELYGLQEKYSNFHFVPALSKPAPEDNWTGEVGLITDVVGRMMGGGDAKEAYLCGSPGMINACIQVLTKNGLTEDRIYYDKFA
jgi:Na+-transporting NADH:ubiquinone oxidoreductase subunit F